MANEPQRFLTWKTPMGMQWGLIVEISKVGIYALEIRVCFGPWILLWYRRNPAVYAEFLDAPKKRREQLRHEDQAIMEAVNTGRADFILGNRKQISSGAAGRENLVVHTSDDLGHSRIIPAPAPAGYYALGFACGIIAALLPSWVLPPKIRKMKREAYLEFRRTYKPTFLFW